MTIDLPEFRPVDIGDKPLIEGFLRAHPSEACEINFTNIYIWRAFERTRHAVINGNLCILCQPPNEPPYFLPPIGMTDLRGTIEVCFTIAPRLSRVPEGFVKAHCGGLLSEPDRDNFDYVYGTGDLILLKGKKYDGKRNHISRLERNFSWRYLRLTPDRMDDCRRLFDEWFNGKAESGEAVGAEKEAILEALSGFESLGLTGGAIEIGGRIAAFSIGEKLTGDTAVVHIEIAGRGTPGLSQLINREFARNEWVSFSFVNREQDVGLPGLRRAKLSYHPHHLVRKYTVTPPARNTP